MYRSLFSVGGFTLLSRGTGFLRDIMLGTFLGAGLLADAFLVALRLPNHFRAIFGEGAFNAAYVPTYAHILETEGREPAHRFSSQIFTMLLASQIVLLAMAWVAMPYVVDLLAPGFRDNPEKFALAVTMTRITFPYLLFITINTLQQGTLNANGYFAAAAFAPVLLNVTTIAFVAAYAIFPNAGIAASWGTVVSGLLQVMMTGYAAWRAGILEHLVRPEMTAEVKRFFGRLGPAIIGSAGPQIAVFADTIIASMLPTGGLSSVYYADRMYQLPIGVIGIAAGTVLLPEMARRLAAGDRTGAYHAQNRTMALSLALTAPFFVAFIMIPEWIMRAVFNHGAFTGQAADASAAVLEAYGFGLMAVVLTRSAVASFQAKGDTRTPMIVTLASYALNVGLKLLLFRSFGAVGLAAATAAGYWLNLLLLVGIAVHRGDMKPDVFLGRTAAAVSIASGVLAVFALLGPGPLWALFGMIGRFQVEGTFLTLGALGAGVYAAVLLFALHAYGIALPLPDRAKRALGALPFFGARVKSPLRY
ncbi:murein biosynthesis integral membrane protein MurJ [Beijerinckia sp. L45]|uniref:murein biosynthesis integral membrane protein MurJ n=1 Tax=Beijerinckia sp. L45 TaxID=1641855 RepID=UPI00131BDD5A|nr:murein biosynthesis integral membrane protein MurJ [Beijerinckia sp. L45]